MMPGDSPQPAATTGFSQARSLAVVIASGLVCAGISLGIGYAIGGKDVGVAALVGGLSAAAGGVVALVGVALLSGPGSSAMAGPMLGMMVRLGATGACVGLAVIGFGFEQRPVLLAAMFGYLVLMAVETKLLYLYASSHRPGGRPTPQQSADQAADRDR